MPKSKSKSRSNSNSNSPPDYNSHNNTATIISKIQQLSRKIRKTFINVELEAFEKLVEQNYKSTKSSFISRYYVIDRIKNLLKKKFYKTITKEEKKELRKLKNIFPRVVELDIKLNETIKKNNILKVNIGDLEIEMTFLLKTINSIKHDYDIAIKKKNKTKIEKYKKNGLEKQKLFKESVKLLKKLRWKNNIESKNLRNIYEQFTKLLKKNSIILTSDGDHFVNDTNYLDPTIELYLNNPQSKKLYTERPPTYKKTQKNHRISKKYFNKWTKSVKSNSYHTADENNQDNNYFSAEENKK